MILGILLFVVPLVGCTESSDKKSEETGIEFSEEASIVFSFEQNGDMCIEKDGETLVESKFSFVYHIYFNDQVNLQGKRYLLEDSSLKEKFYSIVSGKKITLEKTEATTMPKGMSVSIYVSKNQAVDFLVAQDGSIWEYSLEYGEVFCYSSKSGAVDYAKIVAVYDDLNYEYPYTLKRTEEGEIVFEKDNDTVFSFHQADVEKATMGSDYDGNYAWIDDKSWLDVIFDIVFKKEIAFRECVETQWKQLTNVEISLAGDNLEENLKLHFCYGGYIFFYNRVSQKYYVSTFGVMDTTSLEALQFDWIRIQYGY